MLVMLMKKAKKVAEVYFEGEVTVAKTTLWLVGLSCVLLGIVYGLMSAPLTHGVTIGSNNCSQEDCTFNGSCEFGGKKEEEKK